MTEKEKMNTFIKALKDVRGNRSYEKFAEVTGLKASYLVDLERGRYKMPFSKKIEQLSGGNDFYHLHLLRGSLGIYKEVPDYKYLERQSHFIISANNKFYLKDVSDLKYPTYIRAAHKAKKYTSQKEAVKIAKNLNEHNDGHSVLELQVEVSYRLLEEPLLISKEDLI